MKKTTLLLLLMALSIPTVAFGYDIEMVKKELGACVQKDEPACFVPLIQKYSTIDEIRYFYAVSLINNRRFSEAVPELEAVINAQRPDADMKARAQNALDKVNEHMDNISESGNYDAGDYLDDVPDATPWLKPYNIRVYIASNTGKEYVLKSAFQQWDDATHKLVNFSYVNSQDQADIVIKFVENYDTNALGLTRYKDYSTSVKKYLKKAEVEVALKNPGGGSFDDKQLLSVSLHEIGHALGIRGHSKNKTDIMYFSDESYRHGQISKRDVNTLKKIYR